MKLHVYDHCPYCVRARMPLGLKGIAADLVFQDNDDEATPISMIGQKMLPILEDADGFMGESLDIVAKLDALKGPQMFDGDARPELTDWISRAGGLINKLVIPRTPDAVYPEFHTASARAYFTAKKEATFGKFPDLIAETETWKAQLAPLMEELVALLPGARPSIEDILLWPLLRSLSIVPDLALPDAVAAYQARMAGACGVPLVPEMRAKAA